MSTELSKVGTNEMTVVGDHVDDVQFVARDANEMRHAQAAMTTWFANKEAICRKDEEELEDCVFQGMEAGMDVSKLKRQATIARKRAEFYEKCKLASEAGYCVVPNMPAEAFAIRTTKPSRQYNESTWRGDQQVRREYPDNSPAGVGNNVDTFPNEHGGSFVRKTSEGKEERVYWSSSDGHSEIEFPVSVAKPAIMSETCRALALKVFDELQVIPGRRQRKGDPIVLGTVNYPGEKNGFRRVTFLIAWYLDTSTLP